MSWYTAIQSNEVQHCHRSVTGFVHHIALTICSVTVNVILGTSAIRAAPQQRPASGSAQVRCWLPDTCNLTVVKNFSPIIVCYAVCRVLAVQSEQYDCIGRIGLCLHTGTVRLDCVPQAK